jgi:hypothetical protein
LKQLRKRIFLLLAFALAPSSSAADSSTTPGGLRGTLHARSADTAGLGTLEFGTFGSLYTRLDAQDNRHYFWIQDLQLGFGVSPYLELGVDVPVRGWFVDRAADSQIETPQLVGFSDLLGSAKLQLPLPWQRLRMGALGWMSVPTGSASRGFTTGNTDLALGGLMTIDLTNLQSFLPTRIHFNGVYRWNRNETEGFDLGRLDRTQDQGFWPPAYPAVPVGENTTWNDQVLLRSSLEFSTRVLSLFTEFSMDLTPSVTHLEVRDNPIWITQGALLKFRNGFNLKAAVDVSLQKDQLPPEAPKIPDWRAWLGFTWRMSLTFGDSDHDGVPDDKDECPDEAEDFDGFQDDDGCPDHDNDGDGVPDRDDLAPDLPEDVDGFEDEDGRPDMDNDGDGITDDKDECPNEPEDFDGDEDTDGCPH